MVSFPLFERLKAEMPEFDEVTAFQAGGSRFGVRRQDVEAAARPLRSFFVTGNYFSTLGVRALIGRGLLRRRRLAGLGRRPRVESSCLARHLRADPSILGATLVVEGHPFTVVGVTPPGFFGETLRADPADLWIPLQKEP
jgi:hypothetical protein